MADCECGCGAEANGRFIQGHNVRVPGAAVRLACTDPEHERETNGTVGCRTCRLDRARAKRAITYPLLKAAAFGAYGGARCSCCGESQPLMLTIDHVNNDGAEHRRRIRRHGLYAWLKQQGYPPGYQVLCFNCNVGKHLNDGVCPHQTGGGRHEVNDLEPAAQ